jgi:hypothetical protein
MAFFDLDDRNPPVDIAVFMTAITTFAASVVAALDGSKSLPRFSYGPGNEAFQDVQFPYSLEGNRQSRKRTPASRAHAIKKVYA